MSNLDVPISERALLTVAEVAALCGVSLSTAHRWTREGLRMVSHMKEKRVSRRALDEFLEATHPVMEGAA